MYQQLFIWSDTGFQIQSGAGTLEQEEKKTYFPLFPVLNSVLFFPLCCSGHMDSCCLTCLTVMLG